MAGPISFNISSTLIRIIIGGLFAIIIALVVGIYSTLVGDIHDIRKDVHELSTKVDTIHVDVVKSINEVEKQAVATNSKLDGILLEFQRQRR